MFFKKVLSMMVVVALAFSMLATSAVPVMAKSKVKSVKVLKAKKKMTMTVGSKKTFKVKVKAAKKKYTKFTVKSSNKKVLKVTKKGKKIILKALKAGNAKVTVKSKANKKKKYVIKVKVKAAPSKDSGETKPVVVPLTMKADSISDKAFVIDFNKAFNLTTSNIKIWGKVKKDDSFTDEIKSFSFMSEDKKMYTVSLDGAVDEYHFYKVQVTDTDGTVLTAEFEAKDYYKENEIIYTLTASEAFEEALDVDDGIGNYGLVSIENLPEGLEYTFYKSGSIEFEGTIGEKGTYNTVIKVEDRNGVVRTYNITFLVGSDTELVVGSTEMQEYVYPDGTQERVGSFAIDVAGGSGDYGFEIISNPSGVFTTTNPLDDEYEDFSGLGYIVNKPGTYTATVKITDDYDDNVSKTVTVKLVVDAFVKVTGTVKTGSGALIKEAWVLPEPMDSDSEVMSGTTDDEGYYTVYVSPGYYDMKATCYTAEKEIKNLNFKKDSTCDFVMDDVYKITMDNSGLDGEDFGDWSVRYFYDEEEGDYEDEYIGSGNELFLPAGTYYVVSNSVKYDDGSITVCQASASLEVTGDMEVTPDLDVDIREATPVEVGTNDVEVAGTASSYYLFTPEEDGMYCFSSDFDEDQYDPVATLYDDHFEEVAEGDDYEDDDIDTLNFKFVGELEAGKTYILKLRDYDESTGSGQLIIEKLEYED